MAGSKRTSGGRRIVSLVLSWMALIAMGGGSAVHAQAESGRVSKHDRESAKKLAGEFLAQIQASLKAGEDHEACRPIFQVKPTEPIYKSLMAMTDRNIQDVALFNEGTYLEMELEGSGRADRLTVIVRIVDEKCATFEAAKSD